MHFISLFNFTDLCYFYPTVLYISFTVFKMNKVAKSQLCNVHIVIWCCTLGHVAAIHHCINRSRNELYE